MKEQLKIDDLVIEITRSCNTVCAHCLRGEAQNINLDKKVLEEFLSHVRYISTVTFTGGEPSLNPKAILDFIEICKASDIEVGSFYIATNAVHCSDEFFLTVVKLWLFCSDNEISSLDISNDQFHELEDSVVEKLLTLSFAKMKYKEEPSGESMINEGYYAEYYGDGRSLSTYDFMIDIDSDGVRISEEVLTLNCEGNLIRGCDWSYTSQKEGNEAFICSASETHYLPHLHTDYFSAIEGDEKLVDFYKNSTLLV